MARDTQIPAFAEKALRKVLRWRALNQNVAAAEDLRVGRGVVISSPHGLQIGRGVAIGPYTTIQVDGSIGDFCLIGMHVQICGRNDHAIDEPGVPIRYSTWIGDRPPIDRDAVHIGRDVWIGGRSTILSGVTIGEGSIIGAASVVTKNIPPYAIAVGSPARVVGARFADEHTRNLHATQLTLRLSPDAATFDV